MVLVWPQTALPKAQQAVGWSLLHPEQLSSRERILTGRAAFITVGNAELTVGPIDTPVGMMPALPIWTTTLATWPLRPAVD